VALEAGNSPAMVFNHYRQLVTDKEAAYWFSIAPKEPVKPLILLAETTKSPKPAIPSRIVLKTEATCSLINSS
jgi:hypothetical protein